MFFGESFLNGDCAALWIVAPQEKANMSGLQQEEDRVCYARNRPRLLD